MELKLYTRQLAGKIELEIFTTPLKKNADGSTLVVGTIKDITTLPSGKRQVTIEIDERNKHRFKDVTEEEWVETYFEIWHKRRLLLPIKKR